MSLLSTYLLTLPVAAVAAAWGVRRLRVAEPPAGPTTALQTGEPVFERADKLGLLKQHGWMAIVFAGALVVGPLLAADQGPSRAAAEPAS